MDCLTPPLQDSPPGKWHCPSCTHNPSGICEAVPQTPLGEEPSQVEQPRESSVASTSSSDALQPRPPRRGKRRAVTPNVSERNTDISESPFFRGRMRFSTRKAVVPSPPIKRPQLKITPPRPPESPPRRMVVRLKLPAQGKGKEREDSSDEEPLKGLFDDILTPEDRDTSRTAIIHNDKLRFDRSRQAAEVSITIIMSLVTLLNAHIA
jgi:hypothetical protein